MLILLPPSEAKVPGGAGPSLDELGEPAAGHPLGRARARLLPVVARMCRRDTRAVRATLKLPAGTATQDLAANAAVATTPTMAVLDRFSGVLFAALHAATMTGAQRARADASLLVFSGLFGALQPTEPTPLHRVPASATVPRLGGLTPYWRKQLAAPMSRRLADEPVVVDLRSTDYAAMWQPTRGEASRVVPVRVLENRDGTARSISWSAKHRKGLLARELLQARRPPASLDDVAAAAVRLGYDVIERPGRDGQVCLDVVGPSTAPG